MCSAAGVSAVDLVASHQLRLKYPDGRAVAVGLRLFRPEEDASGNWVCTVEADGLVQGPLPCRATGPWAALVSGLRFLHDLLAVEARRGARFFWGRRGDYPIRLEELFPLARAAEPPDGPCG